MFDQRDASTQAAADDEERLSQFFRDYVAAGTPGVFKFLLRAPRRGLGAFSALVKITRITAELSTSVEAVAIRKGLTHKTGWRRNIAHTASSVLVLPDDAAEYSFGPRKQTLRRKARAATKAGVRWRFVDDPEERRQLIALSIERERNHPDPTYRWNGQDNHELLNFRLWLLAYAADGTPLLLSVTPTDGEWALLRYFRTLTDSTAASDARYLMTQVLVEQLVPLGVRYLTDGTSPIGLPNGLRHFQRMLGFRIVRVVVKGRWRGHQTPAKVPTTPTSGKSM